jgi:hypothetical protein
MNLNTKKLDLKSLRAQAGLDIEKARRFSLIGFAALIVVLYGFVLLRINSLSNAQPSQESVTSQVKAARVPRIEQSVVNQLESLHDNSVNVQALFNDTRSNPFQ